MTYQEAQLAFTEVKALLEKGGNLKPSYVAMMSAVERRLLLLAKTEQSLQEGRDVEP